jgi:CIC family chloride channel protein
VLPVARSPGAQVARSAVGAVRLVLALVLVAVGAAGFAIVFRASLGWFFLHVYGQGDVVSAMRAIPLWARVVAPTAGGFTAGLFSRAAARRGRTAGVGEVMEAVAFGRVKLSMFGTLLRSSGTWVALAGGGSVGREGPLIQFGGSWGKVVSRWFRLPADRTRALIAAGTASGFAAAYNTPLAALMFVLEVVTGIVALDAILPAFAATALATVLTRAAVGGGPLYGTRAFRLVSSWELVLYAALGLLAAFAAVGFRRLLAAAERGFAQTRLEQPWRAGLGGLLLGLLLLVVPDVSGNGYEPLKALLDGDFPVLLLLALPLAKAVGTSLSVGSGSPGGVFTPTLLLGAALGGLVGHLVDSAAGPGMVGPPGSYALVGMAAVTAAATHAPAMSAILVFEVSADYEIVLPLLLATAVATSVSRRLDPESIYTAERKRSSEGDAATAEPEP